MTVYRLWDGTAPGAQGSADEDIPTLTDWGGPGTTAQAACVVCPGGGYSSLAPHEGKPIAEFLESIGVRGFVLKYRLGPRYHHPRMLNDAERAMRFVRSRASEFGVDPARLGVIGFSAGGHLASTVSTHNGPGKVEDADPVERVSSRPDWSTLIYPVITMSDPFTHGGSRTNLLGESPTAADIANLSNERAVSLETPPTFLVHGADDMVVPIQNSLDYSLALAGHRVPFELHVPQHGPHGFGLGEPGTPEDWRSAFTLWAKERGLIKA
jgi:acetyl esterase/lipase